LFFAKRACPDGSGLVTARARRLHMSELGSAVLLGPGVAVMAEWSAIRRRMRQVKQSMPKRRVVGSPNRRPWSAPVLTFLGRGPMSTALRMRMAEEWVCVFDGLAGAHARAVFENKDEARQFAERHARAMAPSGMPLKWEDVSESAVL